MNKMHNKNAAATLLAAVLLTLSTVGSAQGQPWPTKPVRLIVPFPAGGNTDAIARILAEQLGPRFGQAVIVENRGGAGGTLGADIVAKSLPDGYTLLLGTSADQINAPFLYIKLPYAPFQDLAPVSLIARDPIMMFAGKMAPVQSAQDLLSYARTNPGVLSFASSGAGTTGHLAGALLQQLAGIRLNHVPYKGSTPAMTDVIGGHVDLLFASPIAAAAHVKTGSLKPIAIASGARIAGEPGVPTFKESGAAVDISTLYFLMAPSTTPPPVLEKLSREVRSVLAEPRTAGRIFALGAEPVGNTTAQASAILASERTKWKAVIQNAKITAN